MVARLRAQMFQLVCKAKAADQAGDRDGWIRATQAWKELTRLALAHADRA